ncbi:MAG: acylphosphatase [Desulfomonilia bacterium]|jgi:acylphosphatase
MNALHLIIRGRVQGVWFRASTQEVANQLGIKGWVRNTPDGAVEAHIQGEDSSVEKMISWCYQGPQGARVDHIDISRVNPDEEYTAFNIRYY